MKNSKKISIMHWTFGIGFAFLIFGLLLKDVHTKVSLIIFLIGGLVLLCGTLWGYMSITCPYCNTTLVSRDRWGLPIFCPECGKKVE